MKTKLIRSITREEALSQVDFAQLPDRKDTDALACRQITALHPVYVPVSDQTAAEAGNRVSIRIISVTFARLYLGMLLLIRIDTRFPASAAV